MMIAFWMLWSTWLGIIAVGVAMLAERALALWRVPRRVVWTFVTALILALSVGGLAWPTYGASPSGEPHRTVIQAQQRVGSTDGRAHGLTIVAGFGKRAMGIRDVWLDRLAPFDVELVVLWCFLTFGLAVRTAIANRKLRRARRAWRADRVDDTDVLVAERSGPAVIGSRRPSIVVPEWLFTYDASLRSIVIAHEREHIRAGDPLLLAFARALTLCLPWSVAMWWAVRRLRLAVEMDCDTRVLNAMPDKRRYGLLLISIAQARSRVDGDVLLATAPGFLRRSEIAARVHVISALPRIGRGLPTALATVALALGIMVACDTPVPVMPQSLTLTGISFRSPNMPTKAEILAFLAAHPEMLKTDPSTVERFDSAAMRRSLGITKMPELLIDGKSMDRAMREAYAVEAPGQPLNGKVRLELDIDDTGRVTRVEAVDPPPLPPDVEAVVAVAVDGRGSVLDVDDGSSMNASPALNRALVKTLMSLARFQPAELDGRRVPLRGWVMTFSFD